jgi:hypothetical protein
MRWEEIVHNNEMDLSASGQFDTMQTIESREECMGISLDMFMIIFEDRSEEFVFGMSDGFDDESVVSREVEERTGFTGGAQFG